MGRIPVLLRFFLLLPSKKIWLRQAFLLAPPESRFVLSGEYFKKDPALPVLFDYSKQK